MSHIIPQRQKYPKEDWNFSLDAWIMQDYLSFDNILDKLNFSRERGKWSLGKIKLWEGKVLPLPHRKLHSWPQPLPLSGWRSVGMRFGSYSKLYIERRITYYYTYLFKLFIWHSFHVQDCASKEEERQMKTVLNNNSGNSFKIFEMKTNLVYNAIYRTCTRNDLFLNFRFIFK